MQQPLQIISIANADTAFAQVFDGTVALLSASQNIKIQVAYPVEIQKKVLAQLEKHKYIGKYIQNGFFELLPIQETQNSWSVFSINNKAFYWLLTTEYFARLSVLYKGFEKISISPNAIYTLAPKEHKTSFWSRAGIRLLHTLKANGAHNNFIAFGGQNAKYFLNLKGLSTQNFCYKIATYAALSGKEVKEANVSVTLHTRKIGAKALVKNAFANVWQWMVKDPLASLQDAAQGSIWQGGHSIWRLLFFCLAILGILTFPILSFDYGITWDEHGDAEYAKRVLNYYTSFGKDKSWHTEAKQNVIFEHLRYYGPSVNLFAAAVSNFSPFGLYETRHIIVSLIGIVGIVYAGRLGSLLGNWQVGTMVILLLWVSPHFFGHSFNNQKDIPFATGYIIAIYYLIWLIKELPHPSRKTILLLSVAMGFAIGVRIGGLLLAAYLLLGMGIWWLWLIKQKGIKNAAKLLLPLAAYWAITTGVAYFIGILFWPFALQNPFVNPLKALTAFTNYQSIYNYELFDGELLFMAEKPWYYLPKYIFIQTPLFVWAGVALFASFFFYKAKDKNVWFWLLLLFAVLFPIGYAIVKNSSLYNGWRQFLFVYPPLVILAAMGWHWCVQVFKPIILKAVLFFLFLINAGYLAFWMVKNHPNQYVYFNEWVGGTKGAYTHYETDYYSNSLKQAANWFIENIGADKPYTISTNNETQTAAYYLKNANPNIQVVWSKEHEVLTKAAHYSFITTRTMSRHQLSNGFFPPKGTLHTISVDGIPLVAIVKRENDYLPLADAFFTKGQFDSAILFAQKAIEYDKNNVEAYRKLAHANISLNAITAAEKSLQRSLQIFPDDYLAIELMGEVFFRKEQYDSALRYFNTAIQLRINFAKGYVNAGVALFKQKKFEQALPYFEKAIKYGTENKANYFVYISKCFHGLKKYNQGIEAANQALEYDANNPEAYKMLAVLYDENGNQQQAQDMYNRYLQLIQ